jgi:hypothetical protein
MGIQLTGKLVVLQLTSQVMVVQMIGQLVVNQLTGKLGTSLRDELLNTGFLRLPRSAHQQWRAAIIENLSIKAMR